MVYLRDDSIINWPEIHSARIERAFLRSSQRENVATGAILYIIDGDLLWHLTFARNRYPDDNTLKGRSNTLKGLVVDSLAITSSAQFIFLENGMANEITSSHDAEKVRFCEIKKRSRKKKFLFASSKHVYV